MSKHIPIACPVLPGIAGYASSSSSDPRVYDSARSIDSGPLAHGAATATPTHKFSGIRYELNCSDPDNNPVNGRPGCDTLADGHKPLFSL